MADQGRYFKLWCSADDDPDLSELSLEDFGRWCKLGMYLKRHGTNGTARFRNSATILQQKFRVQSKQEVLEILRRFPNCDVPEEHNSTTLGTVVTVSFRNWHKYQGDTSTERTRKFRNRERSHPFPRKGGFPKKEISPHTPLLEKTTLPPKENSSSAELEKTSSSAAQVPTENNPLLLRNPDIRQAHPKRRGMGKPVWAQEDLWIPKFLETQTFVNLPPAHLEALQNPDFWERTSELCGGIDLALFRQEFARIGNWFVDNPRRIPTARGIRRFVSGWFERYYERERRYGSQKAR